jgi:methanogenic corrinoid protein MtbC1
MVAQLLELDGLAVRFLGADVPTDSLLAMVRQTPPRLLVLSATMPERLGQLRAAVARVRQADGAHLPIFVGGQVLDWAPDAVRALEVDLAARDALETLAGARRIVAAEG